MTPLDAATVAEMERTSSTAALVRVAYEERRGVAAYDRVPEAEPRDALARCDWCRHWYARRRDWQRFCSDYCGHAARYWTVEWPARHGGRADQPWYPGPVARRIIDALRAHPEGRTLAQLRAALGHRWTGKQLTVTIWYARRVRGVPIASTRAARGTPAVYTLGE